jgi:hypothetical protein
MHTAVQIPKRCDTISSDWVKFLDAVLSDEDRMQTVDSMNSELLTETLEWPNDSSMETMEESQRLLALSGSTTHDTHSIAYDRDNCAMNLLCDETEVDIRMTRWNANRVMDMQKGVVEFFALYEAGLLDDALQKGICVLTQCGYDGVKYDAQLLSSLNDTVNVLLMTVGGLGMEVGVVVDM